MTPSKVMSAPTTEKLATRLRQVRLARRADKAPKPPVTWDVIKVGLTVPTITWLVLLAVVAVVKLAAGDGFSGLGTVTAAGWLAVNQTSLLIGGVTIGVLPLVPTLLIAFGTYRVVRRASVDADSFNELLRVAGTAIVGPLLATAAALAVVADGASASAVGNPNALSAFGMTILVHGAAALIGLVPRVAGPFLDEFSIAASDRVGARAGSAAFFTLIAGGAIAVFAGYLTHFSEIGDMIATGNTFDGYLGLTVLSILYLPNFVVGASAITVGASANLGGTVLDAFSTHAGAVPPVPVAGVVPVTDLGSTGALLFVVPVAAGVLLGWYTRSDNVIAHLRAIGMGAAIASGLMVVATGISGGTLGEMGRAGVDVPIAGVFTFTAVGVTAVLVAGIFWVSGRVANRAAAAPAGDDFDEILDEDFDDDLIDELDADDFEEFDDFDDHFDGDDDFRATDVDDESHAANADLAIEDDETGNSESFDADAERPASPTS